MNETELIQAIGANPGMYLGRKTITGLSHFLDGYGLALSSSSAKYDRAATEGFQQFVAERFRITSSHRWDEIILFFEQDQCRAFDRAMDLFQEYLNSRWDKSKTAIG